MPHASPTPFHALHHRPHPLLLPTAWDAASTLLCQQAGAAAVGTSSAALAWARGHADGGALPRETLLSQVRDILRVATVPVSVDIEDGYSDDPGTVAELAVELASLGVAGINIEDGTGEPELLVRKIVAIRKHCSDRRLFVNARTDVYLRGLASAADAVAMSVQRLRLYQQAGADGAFVPGVVAREDIAAIATAVPMPLNVMTLPGLPVLAELSDVGVKRISAGPMLFLHAYQAGHEEMLRFLHADSSPVPERLDYSFWNRMLDAANRME